LTFCLSGLSTDYCHERKLSAIIIAGLFYS
jgi:hypothetical protein